MTAGDPLERYTDASLARPVPIALLAVRSEVISTIRDLAEITDADLTRPWPWKGGGPDDEEVRYGFYRIGEAFELAGIEAAAALAEHGPRGPAADRIAPATAARWDLHGLLIPLPAAAWDAAPGGDEWTVRETLGHVIAGQRAYGLATGWWQQQGYRADDPALPPRVPETIVTDLPSDEEEAAGTPEEVRNRLDDALDRSAAGLAGLPADRLALGVRWAGFPVDVGFRLGRWSSHIREHTVQVEKTLVMLGHVPTEVDRLIRLVLAAYGRAEAVVFGSAHGDAGVKVLHGAAAGARATAADITGLVRT